MAEEETNSASKHLTAEELIKTRGIGVKSSDDYRATSALPKTGEKLFIPNDSLLQEKQINSSIMSRMDHLAVERVNRLSQLASAEWQPTERRALVTKLSGVEWKNYGKTINGNLYLIPEEALLLLEMNVLELIWKGMPLSIEQAYHLLINTSEGVCSNEYRVFSHLSRSGYHLQRYEYEKSLVQKLEEAWQPKKKVIFPENGQWIENDHEDERNKTVVAEEIMGNKHEVVDRNSERNNHQLENDSIIEKDGEKSMMDVQFEQAGHNSNIDMKTERTGESSTRGAETMEIDEVIDATPSTSNGKSGMQSECQIPEVLRNVHQSVSKIDVDLHAKSAEHIAKSKAARIEIVSEEMVIDPIKIIRTPVPDDLPLPKWATSRIQRNVKQLPKRIDNKRTSLPSSSPIKPQEEVIDLSDDEIQEIPRPLKRMDILNMLPNIATDKRIPVMQKRLPANVCPHKEFYTYNRDEWRAIQRNQRWERATIEGVRYRPMVGSSGHSLGSQTSIQPRASSSASSSGKMLRGRDARSSPYPSPGCANQGVRANPPINQSGLNPDWNPLMFSVLFATGAFVHASFLAKSLFKQMHGNVKYARQPPRLMSQPKECRLPRRCPLRLEVPELKSSTESWSELKEQLHMLKTITIDDDDETYMAAIEMRESNIEPLNGDNYAWDIDEMFKRLSIIKPTPEKIVRKKRGRYCISYKVYPKDNSYNYKKSNPGPQMFNVVVSSMDTPFLQPMELAQIQNSNNCSSTIFAVVTESTINYLQMAVVTLPKIFPYSYG